jgi:hypothetical protein
VSISALPGFAVVAETEPELKAESHSSSELLTALLQGPTRKGAVLDGRQLLFGDYVVLLTPPGGARMPNGIECRLSVAPAARVSIGRGRLVAGHLEVAPGPPWDPVPHFEHLESLPPGPEPVASALGTWIGAPGAGYDALLAGYLAGLVLLHGQRRRAEQMAERAAERAEPLNATLLRHAARGEVPDPVHALLATRNTSRLVASSPAGMAWLRGLLSAGLPLDAAATLVGVRRR